YSCSNLRPCRERCPMPTSEMKISIRVAKGSRPAKRRGRLSSFDATRRSSAASRGIESLQRGISYTVLSDYGQDVDGIPPPRLESATGSLIALAEHLAAEGHTRELGALITRIEQTQDHFSGQRGWSACAALVANIARTIYPTKLPVQPVNLLRFFKADD